MHVRILTAAIGLALACSFALADDWPTWRGPRNDGTVAETGFPLNWSSTENVRWTYDIPGTGHSSPVVSKGKVFITSCIESEKKRMLHCIDRATGRVKWSSQLNQYATEKQRRDPIVWAGPVLASDRLIVAGSHGEALAISPYTGAVLGRIVIGERVFISPIVAGNTIYFLDDTGRVLAMR